MRERNGERRCPGSGELGSGVSWGAALLSLSELWCSATASSETWLHREECESHSRIPKDEHTVTPEPGSWALGTGDECPIGSSVASLAEVEFIQVLTLATPQT